MYNLMPQRFWKTSTAVQEQTVINQSHTKTKLRENKDNFPSKNLGHIPIRL